MHTTRKSAPLVEFLGQTTSASALSALARRRSNGVGSRCYIPTRPDGTLLSGLRFFTSRRSMFRLLLCSIIVLTVNATAAVAATVGAYYYPWYGPNAGGHDYQHVMRMHTTP